MTRKEKRQQIDEWEVDVCENCGHDVSDHRNTPEDIFDYFDGRYRYTAVGCMSLWGANGKGTRTLPGDNPYPRCECLHSV